MPTPLLDALRAHQGRDPAPFHMPGHKGRALAGLEDLWALDLTELSDTSDLYRPASGDPLDAAQRLWADAWGFAHCQLLTGGSTQGLHAALLLCARLGGAVLVDRCCHRSVYNALALFDLRPRYLLRPQHRPVTADGLARALDAAAAQGGRVTTACITSPTYYGMLSDIPALAEVCHARGVLLAVDAAHAAHLPFLGLGGRFSGADLVVTSAHKTLPALGQAALLFAAAAAPFTPRDLAWAASVTGTSSPSYPVLASLDAARDYLLSPAGQAALSRAATETARLRRRWPALPGDVEPLRLTLTVDRRAADGVRCRQALEARGVYPEMADRDHLVFLLSAHTTPRDVARLEEGLVALEEAFPGLWTPPPDALRDALQPPPPQVVLTPAAVLTAPRETLPLAAARDRVAACPVAPYPPGVPVIAPGERITKKCLAYLREVGYNVQESVDVLPR